MVARVVNNVSFTIGNGETVALVGESGSGKTVSAMSILRLLPNSASHPTGEILFEGKRHSEADEAQLRAIRGRQNFDYLPGADDVAQSAAHDREAGRRDYQAASKRFASKQTRTRVLELLTKVGIRDAEKRLGVLSASAFGRPASARDDRDGARERARPADRRRADDRARRHNPGADPGAAASQLQTRDGHGDAAHHARPRHRAARWRSAST